RTRPTRSSYMRGRGRRDATGAPMSRRSLCARARLVRPMSDASRGFPRPSRARRGGLDIALERIAMEEPSETLESVVVRFVGDSGDGMQIAGTQFTETSALAGNDIATFPDY